MDLKYGVSLLARVTSPSAFFLFANLARRKDHYFSRPLHHSKKTIQKLRWRPFALQVAHCSSISKTTKLPKDISKSPHVLEAGYHLKDGDHTKVGCSQFAANAPLEDRCFIKSISLNIQDSTLSSSTSENNESEISSIETSVSHFPPPGTGAEETRSHSGGKKKLELTVAAVLDGHGGWQIADFVARNLPTLFAEELLSFQHATPRANKSKRSIILKALQSSFIRMDDVIRAVVHPAAVLLGFSRVAKCGACACLVVVDGRHLYVGNIGDCKAVLSRGSLPVPLTNEHNAGEPLEQQRLKLAHPNEVDVVVCRPSYGPRREPRGLFKSLRSSSPPPSPRRPVCYVKGRLQPTRSFGDFHLKEEEFVNDKETNRSFVREPFSFPYITAEPEVGCCPLTSRDEFVILGSDGVWDFLSNAEAVDVVKKHFETKGATPESASRAVVSAVLDKAGVTKIEALKMNAQQRRKKYDDITVCIVKLK